jgi:pimeloyl-ACP methyl ester carboxylesterase
MTPAPSSRELAAALKARVHTLDAGHALMTEAPDAVLATLRTAVV